MDFGRRREFAVEAERKVAPVRSLRSPSFDLFYFPALIRFSL